MNIAYDIIYALPNQELIISALIFNGFRMQLEF